MKKRQIWFLNQSLAISSMLLLLIISPASTQSAPDRTEIRDRVTLKKIERNDDRRVQRTDGDSTWRNADRNQVLAPSNWLATGKSAWAQMMYNRFKVIYRQDADTFSQFTPPSGKECGFRVSSGKSLIAVASGNKAKCGAISGKIEVVLPSLPQLGTSNTQIKVSSSNMQFKLSEDKVNNSSVVVFLFRNQDNREVIVGVLANPLGTVTIKPREDVSEPITTFDDTESNQDVNEIQLEAGEFAFISDNGKFFKGGFSLQRFYENNPLTLGLGPSSEDEGYPNELEYEEEKKDFKEVSDATRKALENQPKPGPFEITQWDEPIFRPPTDVWLRLYRGI